MSDMTDNERLLLTLTTAIQKGLQTGRLDISDMAYLQAHLDRKIEEQINQRTADLGERYTDSLNDYVNKRQNEVDDRLNWQAKQISALEKRVETTNKAIDDIKVPGWLHLSSLSVFAFGAITSTFGVFFLFIKSWESAYKAIWALNWWHWISWLMIGLVTLIIIVVAFFIYWGFYSYYTNVLAPEKEHGPNPWDF